MISVKEFQAQAWAAYNYGTQVMNLAASKNLDTSKILYARTQIETMLGDKAVDDARIKKLETNLNLLKQYEAEVNAYQVPVPVAATPSVQQVAQQTIVQQSQPIIQQAQTIISDADFKVMVKRAYDYGRYVVSLATGKRLNASPIIEIVKLIEGLFNVIVSNEAISALQNYNSLLQDYEDQIANYTPPAPVQQVVQQPIIPVQTVTPVMPSASSIIPSAPATTVPKETLTEEEIEEYYKEYDEEYEDSGDEDVMQELAPDSKTPPVSSVTTQSPTVTTVVAKKDGISGRTIIFAALGMGLGYIIYRKIRRANV